MILQQVRNNGTEAILTISLIDEETDTHFVPGSITYDPTVRFNFYGDFLGYYNHYFPQFSDPQYYARDKTFFLETNLYDASSDKLIWSAQSQSSTLDDIDTFSADFSQ